MHSHILQEKAVVQAHSLWSEFLSPSDWVIDATSGNGKDTLFLSRLVRMGGVIALDIQEAAVKSTEKILNLHLTEEERTKIHLFCTSHEEFPQIAYSKKIQLIVYNLGYLPGGNKQIITKADVTVNSIKKSLILLSEKGALSIVCYPGHAGGQEEKEAVLAFAEELDPQRYVVSHYLSLDRALSPSLLWIQKNIV